MLVAVSLSPLSTGSTLEIAAHFEFRTAELRGEFSAAAVTGALKWSATENIDKTAFEIQGSEIVVNVTTVDQFRTGFEPTRPHEPQGQIAKGEPQYVEYRATNATVKSQALTSGANFLLVAPTGAHLTARIEAGMSMSSSAKQTWAVGFNGRSIQTAGDMPTTRRAPIPEGQVLVTSPGGNFDTSGDFSFTIWNASVAVKDLSKSQSYRSGNWTLSETPTVNGFHPAVREVRIQLVEMRVKNGSLQFRSEAGETRFAAHSGAFFGAGTGTITETRGMLRTLNERRDLANTSLSFTGGFDLRAQAGETPAHLAADLELREATVNVAGQPSGSWNDAHPAASARLLHVSSPFALLGYTAAAASLMVVLALRYRRPTIEGAEMALIQDQPRKAVRISRRLLAKAPEDADILFIYGAGLFQIGQAKRVVDEIDPAAQKMEPKKRVGLALLLALAHAHENNRAEAEAWAAEVDNNPQYRKQLGRHPMDLAGLRLATEDAPAGYA